MADLGNQKIKNTYQLVLQADASGNLQKLDGTTPSLVFNSPFTYNVGSFVDGYVLKSDGSGNASWGPVAFSGDVYISGGSIVGDTIELNATSGGTVSIPGLSWSANTPNDTISNASLGTKIGIGTDTPNTPLTVVGDISGTTDLHMDGISYLGSVMVTGQYLRYGPSGGARIWLASSPGSTPSKLQDDWGLDDGDHLYFGSSKELDIYYSGIHSYIDNDNGSLFVTSSVLYLGDTTSETTVQDNLTVNNDLTVNTDTLYVNSLDKKVGVGTLVPDANLTISASTSASGLVPFNMQGGYADFVSFQTRAKFVGGATTVGLLPGMQIQVTDALLNNYLVTIATVPDPGQLFLTVGFPGFTSQVSNISIFTSAVKPPILKVYSGRTVAFQVSGVTVMSGTTDLLDIFSTIGMSGTVTSVALSGSDGIVVNSGSPITDSGTIALGLSNVDATKIADGTVTDTEFQYINTLGSNAQTQLDAKLALAGGTMAGAIAMGTNKVTGMGDPTAAQDAATKAYVDSLDHSSYWSASTGGISNSGLTGNVGIGTTTPNEKLTVSGTISGNSTIVATSYNSSLSSSGYQLNGTKYLWRDGDYLQVGNTTGTVPNTDIIGKSINLQTATTINDNLTVTGNANISGSTTYIGAVSGTGSVTAIGGFVGDVSSTTGYPEAALPSNINAIKIADGTVTSTEFQYINTLSANAQTQLDAKLALAGGTMAGAIAMGTSKVTGMGDPTAAQDAATKNYVDTKTQMDWMKTTAGIKLLSSNNWVGFNRTTGGLDSSGFWNADCGGTALSNVHTFYGSY